MHNEFFHSDSDHTHIGGTQCSADFPFVPLVKNAILKANFIGPLSTKSLLSAQPHTPATYVETEPNFKAVLKVRGAQWFQSM